MATPGPFPHSSSPRTLAKQKRHHHAAPPSRSRDVAEIEDAKVVADKGAEGVLGNAHLTSTIAAVLLVLLAIEGVTVLHVGSLLTLHVFLGFVLIPPIALKIASTSYRFVRYYSGTSAYQRKGPPPALLRLLGPLVVLLTFVLFASGVALLFVGSGFRSTLLTIHQASFILWFIAMTVHVIGHVRETAQLAPRDFYWRTRAQVKGAGIRQWSLGASLIVGVLLAAILVGQTSHFLAR
jgi:hypothetical protein